MPVFRGLAFGNRLDKVSTVVNCAQDFEILKMSDALLKGRFKVMTEDEIAELVSENRRKNYEKQPRAKLTND